MFTMLKEIRDKMQSFGKELGAIRKNRKKK